MANERRYASTRVEGVPYRVIVRVVDEIPRTELALTSEPRYVVEYRGERFIRERRQLAFFPGPGETKSRLGIVPRRPILDTPPQGR